MRQNSKLDWSAIQAAYVFGNASLPDIMRKYGVSDAALRKRIERGRWVELREEETRARCRQSDAIYKAADAVRSARLMEIGEQLADKLEEAIGQLGQYYTIKRKEKRIEVEDEPDEEGKPIPKVIEDVTELSVKGKSALQPAHIKALASALRDLREVSRVSADDAQADTGMSVSFEGDTIEGACE